MTQEHDIEKVKAGYLCQVCGWIWASEPIISCPGTRRYEYDCVPGQMLTLNQLHKKNLKPSPGAKPEAAVYLKKPRVWLYFYDEKNCIIDNPDLPPIYEWDNRGELKTLGELNKLNLTPDPEKKPSGVGWVWDGERDCGKWIPLYLESDCECHAKDNWICKTTLRKTYLLSEGWIKKIGAPDKKVPNPYYRRAAPMKLYSRQRVEQFLADNAEAYATWLDERDRYIAIFEANREKIFYKRNLVKEQTKKCMNCLCGMVTEIGFFCAVHPSGQENLPCPDWVSRRGEEIDVE